MTRVAWNEPGKRRYEAGIDRGVLYLADGSGVAWNGLTSVVEDHGSVESASYYYDGIKYLDTRYPGDFEATIKAYTYPEEFLPFDGYAEVTNAVLLGHQPVYDRFGLSYRTKIGNDLEGTNAGYKIHILYNLVAIPSDREYATAAATVNTTEFEWHVSGVPEPIAGNRPTVHIILDTTKLNPFMIRDLEDLLYGTDFSQNIDDAVYDGGTPDATVGDELSGGTPSDAGFDIVDGGTPFSSTIITGSVTSVDPLLPPLSELVDLLNSWVLIDIVDNGDGTWTASGPSEFIQMVDSTTFRISSPNAKMLNTTTYEISTSHAL